MESEIVSIKEQVSGWVDGFDPHGRIGDMRHGGHDRHEAWSRYHLIGSLMRGDCCDATLAVVRGGRLADRIAVRLEDEPPLPAPAAPIPVRTGGRWNDRYKGVAALALAAGVAAAAVIALRPGAGPGVEATSGAVQVARQTQATQWNTTQPEHANDLNSLLVEHGEFTAPSGLNGLIAYAKFVSYDASR